jgi:putative ABC transport system permease protein
MAPESKRSRVAPVRAALRIGRRAAWRAKGRSALIIAMVAIPVAGLSGVALVGMSMLPAAEETVAMELGATEGRFQLVSPPDSSLVQNPTTPEWYQRDVDSEGVQVNVEPGDAFVDPDALLPDSRIIAVRETTATVESASGIAGMTAFEGEVWDPAFAPKYTVTGGRVPATAGEVMVTASTLERLGVRMGESVQLQEDGRDALVVGVIDAAEYPDSESLLFGPLGAFSGETRPGSADSYFVVGGSLSWAEVQQLNQQGAVVLSRAVLLDPPPAGTYLLGGSADLQGPVVTVITLTAVGLAFALVEVALLAGAAFAVGARQDRRSLAIVASTGGQRGTLFHIVSAGGLVLGAAGGIVGLGVGVVVGSIFMAVTADGSGTQYWGYHLSVPIMAGVALFAIVVGWLAALVPAWAASRMDVLAALRGARRPGRPSRSRPWVGFALTVLGIAVTLAGAAVTAAVSGNGFISNTTLWSIAAIAIFAGPVVAQLGAILLAPSLLRTCSRAANRLGLGARLAARDASRNPGRSVPALAAVMGAVFVATAVIGFAGSSEQTDRENYEYTTAEGQLLVDLTAWDEDSGLSRALPIGDEVVAAISSQLDTTNARVLSGEPSRHMFASDDDALVPQLALPEKIKCEPAMNGDPYAHCAAPYFVVADGGGPKVWVGSVADLALILDAPVSVEAQRMLRAGGAVALYPEYVHDDGTIMLEWRSASEAHEAGMNNETAEPRRTETVKAVVQEPKQPISSGVFMLDATAASLGFEVQKTKVLAALDTPPTANQMDALRATMRSVAGGEDLWVRYEAGPPDSVGTTGWAVVALAALIALASAAVALGLARVDGRRDDATLRSIGASPVVRRNFAFWQAALIAGLGSLIGATLGLTPTLAGGWADVMPFAPPWLQLLAISIGLPVAIAVASWLLAGRRVNPRR